MGEAFCRLIETLDPNRLPHSGGLNATVVVTIPLGDPRRWTRRATMDTGTRFSPGEARADGVRRRPHPRRPRRPKRGPRPRPHPPTVLQTPTGRDGDPTELPLRRRRMRTTHRLVRRPPPPTLDPRRPHQPRRRRPHLRTPPHPRPPPRLHRPPTTRVPHRHHPHPTTGAATPQGRSRPITRTSCPITTATPCLTCLRTQPSLEASTSAVICSSDFPRNLRKLKTIMPNAMAAEPMSVAPVPQPPRSQ